MIRVSYFPGCSAHGTGREFDQSLKLVMNAVDVELVEVPDWNCCGASSAHVLSETLALALPMRNLSQADRLGNGVMAIPCASCYSRHRLARMELAEKPELRRSLQTAIDAAGGATYVGTTEVKSMLQILAEDVGADRVKSLVTTPLTGLKVACYYGCLLTRPKAVTQFDSPEHPVSMDRLMTALGATPTGFDHKTECCGASFSISNTAVVHELTGRLLEAAKDSEADLIAVACPLCQSNLDMRQAEIEARSGVRYNLPIVYFTQLMAMAFGVDRGKLEFERHFVPVEPALKSLPALQPVASPGQQPRAN